VIEWSQVRRPFGQTQKTKDGWRYRYVHGWTGHCSDQQPHRMSGYIVRAVPFRLKPRRWRMMLVAWCLPAGGRTEADEMGPCIGEFQEEEFSKEG
jgi:hypothetical protein